MTPTEEVEFIALWSQGLTTAAIAQQLGIPVGTVKSRAHTLAHAGKLTPRPRGGARQQGKALQAGAEVSPDTPRVSKRVPPDTPQRARGVSTRVSADTPAAQYLPPSQDDMRPLLTDILLELRQLTGALATRVSTDTPRVSGGIPGMSTGVSARIPLPAARGKSVRWNLHLSEQLRTCIKAKAEARGLQDSQMVEELLWLALAVSTDAPPLPTPGPP